MYDYQWDNKTRGYKLKKQTEKFVAAELRPVFCARVKAFRF